MYYSQQIEGKKETRTEFLKIYALTLVTAFVLMAVVRFRAGCEPVTESQQIDVATDRASHPIADADELFPLQKLKNLIVNLSF